MTTGAETRDPPKTRAEVSAWKDPLSALQRTTEAEPSETPENFLQQGMTDPALIGLIILIIWAPFVYFCLHFCNFHRRGHECVPPFCLPEESPERPQG